MRSSVRPLKRSNGAEGIDEETGCYGGLGYGGGSQGQSKGPRQSKGLSQTGCGKSPLERNKKKRSGRSREIDISLEERRRGRPAHRDGRGAGGWSRAVRGESLSLHSGSEGGRHSEEDRTRRRRTQSSPSAVRDNRRRSSQSPWYQSTVAVPGARVSSRLWKDRDRGKVPSWTTSPAASSRRCSRRLDDESSWRRTTTRRGRACTIAGEGCSPDRGRPQGGREEGKEEQLVKKSEQKEKEKEGQEEKGEEEATKGVRRLPKRGQKKGSCKEVGWQAPQDSRPEEASDPLCGDRLRWKGKGPRSCSSPGQKVCEQEERQVEFVGELFGEFQLISGGGHGGRELVPGGEQSPSCFRAFSRGPQLRDPADDAEQLDDTTRRGSPRLVGEAGSDPVLQAGDGPKSFRGFSSRDADACDVDRPSGSRKTSLGLRRVVPEVEVVREHLTRDVLADCSKDGDTSGRGGELGTQGGAPVGAEGELPGCQDLLPGQGKEPGQRTGKGRKIRLQGRPQRRSRSLWQRKGERWEERRQGEERSEVEEEDYDGSALEDSGITPGGEDAEDSEPHRLTSEVGETAVDGSGTGPPAVDVTSGGGHSSPGLLVKPVKEVDTAAVADGFFTEVKASSGSSRHSEEKDACLGSSRLEGCSLGKLGNLLVQQLLEVFLSLRSKSTGGRNSLSVFPLPTSRGLLKGICPDLSEEELTWLLLVCLGLNSMWGGEVFYDGDVSGVQRSCLLELCPDVSRICSIQGTVEIFDWSNFFSSRTVDYQGDEVKVARSFCWENIAPALPREIGSVPLADICTLGCRYYVENFDLFIKPRDQWPEIKKPKVMVHDSDWGDVCTGLVEAGICQFLPKEDLFEGPNGPLLNGLFGVTKDEMANGVEVYRLIMNLIPLNSICESLAGDVNSLPGWSLMNPFFMQPTEELLISSEDVRCFFYVMRVPDCWVKYLGFNKIVPPHVLPESLVGREVYLAARVLPMGFLNSVSLAQHVHRNLVLQSPDEVAIRPEEELRKDRPFSKGQRNWRVYLDNFDLLEKVEATQVVDLQGTTPPAVLALREQYVSWDVPRNLKKSVSRENRAEVQGAQIDGKAGVAYPREQKLLKYVSAGMAICSAKLVTQRQLQVVCGGLVYLSMFRRPMLGCLNQVWRFIESFNGSLSHRLPLPQVCKLEILRFLSLIPLTRLDFRLRVDSQVTCSDASSTGGGICASAGLTPMGVLASQGYLRGEMPESRSGIKVLSVGLFDGIGALRVALDLLEVDVIGHISVEVDPYATRVVESQFPETEKVSDVSLVDYEMVHRWSGRYSQASLVLLGAGPPCQGVSGLNADRKGALRDHRSSLFVHVKRIEGLFKRAFPWAPVHSLMESVASMDEEDRQVMSDHFEDVPWKCDAKYMLWCCRPRLYWITWSLSEGEGVEFDLESVPRELKLHARQAIEEICKEGWMKADPVTSFPTFTTSRPRRSAGHRPAGINQCSIQELERWSSDAYRFPPYQYRNCHCLINRAGDLRLPSVEERESIMGFPVNYTASCMAKSQRGSQDWKDCRLSLVGNSWAVPVVAWLISQLLWPLGLCRELTPQDVVDKLSPEHNISVQSRLLRMPLRPLRGLGMANEEDLTFKLTNLVSMKGEDILIMGKSSEQVKYHRLRASIPSRLWKWKVVAGWKWANTVDHINSLELRAILTTLMWRVGKKMMLRRKFVHLTDSLVCLHSLTRGRSSSVRLRRTLCRINALLLISSSQAVWAYVHTDQNPADKPSRWGCRVKSKFRNA